MTIGEKLKQLRTAQNISVDFMAKKLGVSRTTIYRYEDSSIEKIPINIFDRMCSILGVAPSEIMSNMQTSDYTPTIPDHFSNPQEAMEFLLKIPTLAAYGGYDPAKMSEQTITDFANEILNQFELVSYKYK